MKKLFGRIGLMLMVLLLVAVGVLFIPTNRQYAYEYISGSCGTAEWAYHRLFNNDNPIDIAFLGSSHTICAVNDSLLQNLIPQYQIANLGFCRLGRNLQYEFTQDLFKEKAPKLLLIEVREIEATYGHPDYAPLASAKDLLAAPIIGNKSYLSDLGKGLLFKRYYFQDIGEVDTKKEQSQFIFDPNKTRKEDPQKLADYKQKRPAELKKPKWQAGNRQAAASRHYLALICELAKDNNCEVVFLYLPNYGAPIDEPVEIGCYGKFSTVLIPPAEVLGTPEYWMDVDHLNVAGANQLTPWLADELRQQLKNQDI